jgi:hypothetical protein
MIRLIDRSLAVAARCAPFRAARAGKRFFEFRNCLNILIRTTILPDPETHRAPVG